MYTEDINLNIMVNVFNGNKFTESDTDKYRVFISFRIVSFISPLYLVLE